MCFGALRSDGPFRARGNRPGWIARRGARLPGSLIAFLVSAVFMTTCPAITIDWVTVGNPGNAADSTTGYGNVNYEYRIGKYEVTIAQYTEFLNAVAASDPFSLYSWSMGFGVPTAGISRSGAAGSYTYSVIGPFGPVQIPQATAANRPITHVSWFDAARFANWMHNGQGAGSTETGAYTLNGATSGTAPGLNPGAQFSIPTQNEWYKAAYYSPVLNSGSGGYYTFATQSDTQPGNVIGSAVNQANYYAGNFSMTQLNGYSSSQNYLTDVGAFTNSASYYGTFDQNGNVSEWNDLTGSPSSNVGRRGGSWADDGRELQSTVGRESASSEEQEYTGFRLASPATTAIPEIDPAGLGSVLALVTGTLGLVERKKRRRD